MGLSEWIISNSLANLTVWEKLAGRKSARVVRVAAFVGIGVLSFLAWSAGCLADGADVWGLCPLWRNEPQLVDGGYFAMFYRVADQNIPPGRPLWDRPDMDNACPGCASNCPCPFRVWSQFVNGQAWDHGPPGIIEPPEVNHNPKEDWLSSHIMPACGKRTILPRPLRLFSNLAGLRAGYDFVGCGMGVFYGEWPVLLCVEQSEERSQGKASWSAGSRNGQLAGVPVAAASVSASMAARCLASKAISSAIR